MKYNDSPRFENLQNRAVVLKTLWAVCFVLCIVDFVELDYVCCGLCILYIVYAVSCVCSGLCMCVEAVYCRLCVQWTVFAVSCVL